MFQNDDWDIDEDYFEDFNADQVVKDLQDEKKKVDTLVIQQNSQLVEKVCTSNLQFQLNCDKEMKVKDSSSTGIISHKNVVLDIFKNNHNKQKNFDSSKNNEKIYLNEELHDVSKGSSILECNEPNKKNLILNIFQNNNTTNVKIDNTNKTKPIVKSVLKFTDTYLDSENKFKRKKSVAFKESTDEPSTPKKKCISDKNYSVFKQTSSLKNSKIISESDTNSNVTKNDNLKKQRSLNSSKLLFQKNKNFNLLKKTVIRKFPGPAGLSFDDSEEIEVVNIDVDKSENKNKKYSDICSQNTKNLFTTGAWQLMMDDLPADFELQDIATVKENALEYSKKFKKVSYLAGIIHYIDYKPNDPHVILKDFSGKIDARIHHSICKLYPNVLGTNIVILVKDIGVIVTSKKYVCVIISPKNLVSIYSDDSRLVQTSLLDNLLNSNSNFDLHNSQINLFDYNDNGKNKILHENLQNVSSRKQSVLKENTNINLLDNFMDKKESSSENLSDNSMHNLNIKSNSGIDCKVADHKDDVQDFDFQEDESWFEVDINDLNSFTAHQFPSSTPMIIEKDDSQNKIIENTICENFK